MDFCCIYKKNGTDSVGSIVISMDSYVLVDIILEFRRRVPYADLYCVISRK